MGKLFQKLCVSVSLLSLGAVHATSAHAAALVGVALAPELVVVGGVLRLVGGVGAAAVATGAAAKDKAEPAPGKTRSGNGRRSNPGGNSVNQPSGSGYGPHLDEGRGQGAYGPHVDEGGGRESDGAAGGQLFRESTGKLVLWGVGLTLAAQNSAEPLSVRDTLDAMVDLRVLSAAQADSVHRELLERASQAADAHFRLLTESVSKDLVVTAQNQPTVLERLAHENNLSESAAKYFLFVMGKLD